jgi:RND family efflux transporter MFP subunit
LNSLGSLAQVLTPACRGALSAVVCLGACLGFAPSVRAASPPAPAPSVRAASPPTPAPATRAASVPTPALAQAPLGCVIEPMQTAEVAAAANGVLESVSVERGATVRRGQVIARLQSDVERAAVESARARSSSESEIAALGAARDLAKLRLKRMHALSELQFGARIELETAAAEFEIADHKLQQAREVHVVAKREHELARRQLEQRVIRSPIDGIVADRLLQPGERVDGRPLLRLVALDRLRVEVVLPASRYGRIREGMHASVRPDLPDAPEVSGRVVQVDRFVDAASSTFRARLSLPNADGRVPAGVRCQLVFDDAGPIGPRPVSLEPAPAAGRAGAPPQRRSRPAGQGAGRT